MAVPRLTFPDHGSFQHIERREQRRRPVAFVVVRLLLGQAGTQGKDRLRPVQRLNLTLLIHAQNDGFFWRIQIQPHNVTNLPRKLRITTELERLDTMRLQFVFLPDSLHRRGTDSLHCRHRAHAPLRRVLRSRLHGGLDDGRFSLCGNAFGTTTAGTVFEKPCDSVTFKSLPPQQHGRHRGAQFSRQDPIGQSFGRTEDNLNTQDNTTRRTPMTAHRGQMFSLCILQGKSRGWGKWHSSSSMPSPRESQGFSKTVPAVVVPNAFPQSEKRPSSRPP